MSKQNVSVPMTLWLLAVWVIVFQSLSWVTIISGLLLALAVQLVFPMPGSHGIWHVRILYLTTLILKFVWDLVRAGIEVSGIVLSNRDHPDGIVECRLKTSSPVYLTILAAICSMVPGTVVLRVDPTERTMYLHCLNLPGQGGADGVRKAVAAQEKLVLLALATNRAVVDAGYGRYLPLVARKVTPPVEAQQEEEVTS